jgi:hypothetical protein
MTDLYFIPHSGRKERIEKNNFYQSYSNNIHQLYNTSLANEKPFNTSNGLGIKQTQAYFHGSNHLNNANKSLNIIKYDSLT